MSTQEALWQATTCYVGGKLEKGRVIAISTYVDRRRICFQLNGEEVGQWVPEEAVYLSISSLEAEKEAQKEANNDVNTLVKILEKHQEIVVSRSVKDIEKISRFLKTVISGFEFGEKLVGDTVSSLDKVVLSWLGTIAFIVEVKDQILRAVNELWSRYWKERVLSTLIKGEKIERTTSKKIVDQLKIDYPGETNHQLAERIVFEKAVYTSITGFIQGLIRSYADKIPKALGEFLAGKKGFEVLQPLLSNHLVNFFDANTLLEEMIYQISLIYGLKSREGDTLAILATALTQQVAHLLEMEFLIGLPSDVAVTPLVSPIKNMLVFMLVGKNAIDYYEAQKETGKMPIASLEDLRSLEDRGAAYLTEILSKSPELEQALANAISVEAVAVPELLSATRS